MPVLILYLLVAGAAIYWISRRAQTGTLRTGQPSSGMLPHGGTGSKEGRREVWKQVYETASMEEAGLIRKRLEEEGIACILYEQGKRDIHGDLLKGVGVAVPGAVASRAQESIAKMPV